MYHVNKQGRVSVFFKEKYETTNQKGIQVPLCLKGSVRHF